MTTGDRRQREKQALRAKILDAARELFAARGFESVSMRQIAAAIDYSPTAIYDYFRDKEGLFHELCAEDFSALAKMFGKLDKVGDPVERIRRIGLAYVDFAIRHPNHYRLMFMTGSEVKGGATSGAATDGTAEDRKVKARGNPDEDAYAFLRGHVAEAYAAGRFRKDLGGIELLTQTFWAGVHGVASLQIAKGQDPWVDWRPLRERAHAMVEVLVRGTLKP